MSQAPADIRRTAAGGVLWTASSQALRQILQVAITAILARRLVPDDFGLIGMAAVTLAFVAPLNELGMGSALVQRRELTPGHASAVFWSQVGIATGAGLLLALIAPYIAFFFRRGDLAPLLRLMCFNLPIGAMAAAPQALLLRSLRFRTLAMVETISLAGAGIVGAGMALSGWGVWSLAGQALAGTLLTTALLLPLSGFNPLARGAAPRAAHIRELAGFSAPLTGYQLLNYASRNLDDILIGRMLGAGALGYYSMAYRVMMYPLQKVSGVVGRVSFPAFSSLQDDLPRVRRGYLKAVQYIALVTFPMMAAVMVAAPQLTHVLFGPGWAPVAPLILVLSLAGMSGSIGTTVGSIFLSKGRSDLMLKWEIAASLCYTVAIVTGLRWGLMGVAVCYTATSLILWPISHLIANRLIGLTLPDLFRALAGPALLAAAVAAPLLALRLVWAPVSTFDQGLFLGAGVLVAVAAFATAAAIGRPAALTEALALGRETLLGPSAAPRSQESP